MFMAFRTPAITRWPVWCLLSLALTSLSAASWAAGNTEIAAADEANQRGIYEPILIYSGQRFNVYKPSIRSGFPEFMVIQQASDDEPLIETEKSAYISGDNPFAKQLIEIVKAHSGYPLNSIYFGTVFLHFVRGVHRPGPGGAKDELPILRVHYSFNQATGQLRQGMVTKAADSYASYTTLAQARASGARLEGSTAFTARRDQEAAEQQNLIDLANQRIQAEKEKGFLVQGAKPWTSYSNGAILESLFRGDFKQIQPTKPRTHANLYYLYLQYSLNFARRCADHLPPDAVSTRIVRVERLNDAEIGRQVTEGIPVHPELADAYVYYGNHHLGANMIAIRDIVRGGVESAQMRQESWDLDMQRLFKVESCDGQALRQLRQNMSRLYQGKPSVQAESGI